MSKMTKKCRVCGKEYEACKSVKTGSSVFNWREVACSPECGMEYLRRIEISRGAVNDLEPDQKAKATRHAFHGKYHREAEVEEVAEPIVIFEAEAEDEPADEELPEDE